MAMEKTFDAATAEPAISAKWEAANAFRAGANAREGAEPFCILLPPPNVTGSLHMGHAFNHTLMDVLTRWHRMKGDDVLWQPGLDHAGIATQMVVERKLATDGEPGRRELGREAFVEKVWEWKEQSGGTILGQCERLGDSFDLSRNRFTMDPGFHDAVLRAFVEFYDKGLIYRGKRLVNWDPHFETAISDLEVENIDVDGHMWHFRYPLAGGDTYEYIEKDADGNVTLRETRDYISIATTRPETMLGDGAVAVHPSDERYAPIVGKLCEIPVGPKESRRLIPIITDEYPDPDFGSGAVKITGAHDFNDYAVAQRNNIPLYVLMDTKGHMRADGASYAEASALARAIAEGKQNPSAIDTTEINLVPEEYRGLDRFDARKRVVADISAEGLAVMVPGEDGASVPFVESKKITQPFGDRSKVVIEPMLTDQWFVDAAKLAGPALAAVREGRTRILPESQEKTYYHWLENIEPWCISRQLWWGHRIPVWYDADGTPYCAATEEEAREKAGGRELTRDPDVLDTWFSSGIWPIGTLGWPEETPELAKFHPTSVLVTGFDILFFWVARMMMMQIELKGEVPFRDVYIHALVRDEKGKKMSKSLGNILDPLDLIDEFGADAVRFTLASMAAMGRDVRLSRDRIAGYRNFGTKLWNAARFAEMNDARPQPDFDPASVTRTANKWIVGETGRVREAVDEALAAYRFNDAASALYAHVWGKVCDWYVELAKPLFQDEAAAEETRATLGWVIDQCLVMLHPFMPFVTEALWEQTGDRDRLLAHAAWPVYGAGLVDAGADAEMGWVIGLIEEIRSVRAQMRVPAGAKIPLIRLDLSDRQVEALERNQALVARLARVESFSSADQAPKGAVTIARDGATFCLPLADVVDVEAEQKRLEKAIGKLAGEMKGLDKKLSNEAFLSKAPDSVIEENRTRLEAAREETLVLETARKRLAELG